MLKTLNGRKYYVNSDEFVVVPHLEYTSLRIIPELAVYERYISFFNELIIQLSNAFESKFIIYNPTHGGFIPINCAKQTPFGGVLCVRTAPEHHANLTRNIQEYAALNPKTEHVIFSKIAHVYTSGNGGSDDGEQTFMTEIGNFTIHFDELGEVFSPQNITMNAAASLKKYKNIIITPCQIDLGADFVQYSWAAVGMVVYISQDIAEKFAQKFCYYIQDGQDGNVFLEYDNLNQLCIMVKNAGPQFEDMLRKNMPYFDRWTILDTGSTDGTQDIVRRVLVGTKQGTLYEEPFINFRDSRNRLLDLAGNSCKFITMLDDTYVLEGNLREFLEVVRGDQYSNSFTLFIQSDDTTYGSNRILKADCNLRYIHKIHEVITDKDNMNVIVPMTACKILDGRFDYMEKRTMERKQLDLKLLFEELEEDPNNPRTYYYLAQTYNLLENYEKAFYYFLRRAEFANSGFIQERVDAFFEAARLANFKLNKSWDVCLSLYEKAAHADETRPEPHYFIGIHYYLDSDYYTAFKHFKRAFDLGFPEHAQYGLKPSLSYHFLPKFLCKICYNLKEYEMGEKSAELFLQKNDAKSDDYTEIASWYLIYRKLNEYKGEKRIRILSVKPILCFVADGGFKSWSGSSIEKEGVGGSETYIIEMASHIAETGQFEVVVFCNTPEPTQPEFYRGVQYRNLSQFCEFVYTNYVHTCIVSRFSEYLPVAFDGWVEQVFFVVHDLSASGIVIPLRSKLKNIFCLSEWHAEYFSQIFPPLKDRIVPFYYGISDQWIQTLVNRTIPTTQSAEGGIMKLPNVGGVMGRPRPFPRFIYSSFANRGLLPLLQMWPRIVERFPCASLAIFCDLDNHWVNQVEPVQIQQIRQLLAEYGVSTQGQEPNLTQGLYNITYHGWVSKAELYAGWQKADVWFYPCIFQETFCLTALEAALSKTLAITNGLAALQNTAAEGRSIVIPGDPMSAEWQSNAITQITENILPRMIANDEQILGLITQNYEWACQLSWKFQADKLLQKYILSDPYEYKLMHNWTHNLPAGNNSRANFLEILRYFVAKNNTNYNMSTRILEVGVYTGTSLIAILQQIPYSVGVAIDSWTNYDEITNERAKQIDVLEVEKSFYRNVERAGMKDRIRVMKGDSTAMLLELHKKSQMFDLIYVDGSHMCLDCYADIVLAWNILNSGGILIIDDYTFERQEFLKSPYEAVEYFLKKNAGQYKILKKEYRMFLEKN